MNQKRSVDSKVREPQPTYRGDDLQAWERFAQACDRGNVCQGHALGSRYSTRGHRSRSSNRGCDDGRARETRRAAPLLMVTDDD